MLLAISNPYCQTACLYSTLLVCVTVSSQNWLSIASSWPQSRARSLTSTSVGLSVIGFCTMGRNVQRVYLFTLFLAFVTCMQSCDAPVCCTYCLCLRFCLSVAIDWTWLFRCSKAHASLIADCRCYRLIMYVPVRGSMCVCNSLRMCDWQNISRSTLPSIGYLVSYIWYLISGYLAPLLDWFHGYLDLLRVFLF